MIKRKIIAYVLSFLLAGVGQMYLGNFTRGVIILISAVGIGMLSFATINEFGLIPSLIFFVWQIWDAGKEYEKRRYVYANGNIICSSCDWTNVSLSEYCTKCGHKIQMACPNCNSLNIPNISFCGKCGKKF